MKGKHLFILTATLLAVSRLNGSAAGREISNVSASPHVKFRTIGLGDARSGPAGSGAGVGNRIIASQSQP